MKNYLVFFCLMLLSSMVFGQEVTVTGQVTNTDGTSLPGVNIIEKGTSNGTITDFEGSFSLETEKGKTLVFSFIGFESVEQVVDGNGPINLQMQEASVQLEEAVVTALGISQSKKSVGYATQEVKPEKLQSGRPKNIANMLTGRVAGLNVSNPTGLFQGAEYNLRGKNPLIVVDNVPVTSEMWELNPEDIDQINVLKGTTASALYGSNGRNGAILITTKNATKEGLEIEVSTNTMVTAGYVTFPDVQEEYGNGSQGKYEFWDGAEGGISDGDMIWGPKFSTTDKIAQWNSPLRDNETGEEIPWYGDVTGTKYDDKSRYSRVPIAWEHHDFLKEFLEPGYVTSNSFAINYKGQRSAIRFSGNYAYQKGRVPNTSLQTGGVKLNANFKLTPTLTLDGRFAYDKIYSPNYPRYGYGPKNHIYTILIWMGWDVDPKDLRDHLWVPGQEGYRQANWNYAWYNNPYFAANKLNQEFDENVYKGNVTLNWDLTRDLSLTGRISAIGQGRFEDRESPKSYLNYGDPREGDYKTWNRDWLTMDNDIHATYKKQLNTNLNLTVNAGAAAFLHRYEHYYAATDGLVVPEVYSLNNTQNNVKAETYFQQKAIRSVYGTMDIDIMDAFFLTFAARNDWSSALPASNDSYFYPSASLSTMVSNLIDLPDVFDYFKVYGSWAEVSADLAPRSEGNPSKVESEWSTADMAGYGNPYQISSYYNNIGTFNGMIMLSYPGSIINPNIKPEKSTSYELGLSTSFKKKRIGFEFTYFNVVDENQILYLPLASSTGFDSRLVNGNEYTTKGLEFAVTARPVHNSNFKWEIAANASHMVKEITGIYGGEKKYGTLSLNERVDNIYGTGWMKSPDGEVILDEESGMPSRDQFPQLLGHSNPDVWYGLQNTFQMGKFTLNMDFDGTIGGVMVSQTVKKMWWGGKHPESLDHRDEQYATDAPVYLPKGVNVTEGELIRDTDGEIISDTRVFQENTTKVDWQTWCQNYPYRANVTEDESEQFANVLDRSFIKLRRLALTYDMSDIIKGVAGFKAMEATIFSYNVFMMKKAKIIDPDFGRDDELQDPATRYIGLNLSLKF